MPDLKLALLYVKEPALLGDEVISKTGHYLIDKILKELKIKFEIFNLSMLPPPSHYKALRVFQIKIRKLCYVIFYKLFLKNFDRDFLEIICDNVFFLFSLVFWIVYVNINKELNRHYENILKDKDIVVFVGGGIFQHSYMQLWRGIYPVARYCNKNQIPVYYNAIGIEKPSIFIEQLFYKYLLNQNNVKAVTTRDDFDYLNQILNKKIYRKQILDPALWTNECYQVQKQKNDIIGIGIIRPKIFSDSEITLTPLEVENIFINIIGEVNKRGFKWELFCNGGEADFEFGLKLLKRLNLPESYIANRPLNDFELVNCIKKYRGIIAARLHANIIATSLGISALGIVWNNKLVHFSKFLKMPCAFITKENFSNDKFIVDELQKALDKGLDIKYIGKLKEYSYIEMKNIFSRIVKNKG